MADSRFKPLEHPSDVGIIAYGKDLKEIFENAAFGMFSTMADLNSVSPGQKFEIKVEGEDLESLLVNWLSELIYLEDAKKVLFKEFKIEKMTDKLIQAQVKGEKIRTDEHVLYRPIKAVTYNQLQIDKNQAKIVFDV